MYSIRSIYIYIYINEKELHWQLQSRIYIDFAFFHCVALSCARNHHGAFHLYIHSYMIYMHIVCMKSVVMKIYGFVLLKTYPPFYNEEQKKKEETGKDWLWPCACVCLNNCEYIYKFIWKITKTNSRKSNSGKLHVTSPSHIGNVANKNRHIKKLQRRNLFVIERVCDI